MPVFVLWPAIRSVIRTFVNMSTILQSACQYYNDKMLSYRRDTSYLVPFRSYRSLLFKFRTNAATLTQNFRQKGSPPTNHFCTGSQANECLTTLSLTVFTQLLRLRRYERKQVENRRFCTNAATLIQNFWYKGSENQAKCSFIWYINLDRSFYRFVTIHACDRRTDRILLTIPRLHYMQRGEKGHFESKMCEEK